MNKKGLKHNSAYLLEVCKGLETLRQDNKRDIRESQKEAVSGANKTLSDLNKYLFTVATLLIPIIFSLVGIKDIRESINPEDSILLKEAILFLFISLLIGFCHMMSEVGFYRKWLMNAEERLKLWSSISFFPGVPTAKQVGKYIKEYEGMIVKIDSISSEMKKQSTTIFIFLQGIFWTIGVILIVIVAFHLLY